MPQLIIQLPPDIPTPKFTWGQQVQIERSHGSIRGKVIGFEWWTLQASAAYDRSIDSAGWHYVVETSTRSEPHAFSHEDEMEALAVQCTN